MRETTITAISAQKYPQGNADWEWIHCDCVHGWQLCWLLYWRQWRQSPKTNMPSHHLLRIDLGIFSTITRVEPTSKNHWGQHGSQQAVSLITQGILIFFLWKFTKRVDRPIARASLVSWTASAKTALELKRAKINSMRQKKSCNRAYCHASTGFMWTSSFIFPNE